MSKNELYELRQRLIDSEKYKTIIIDGSYNNTISLDIINRDRTYLKENIVASYKNHYDEDAALFLEKSCERLIRILADKNIPYDSIEVLMRPTFFMKEYNLENDVDEDFNINQNMFKKDMLIDNGLVNINYILYVKNDGQYVNNFDEINEIIDKMSLAKFLVDYDNFARCIALNGYYLEEDSYDKLICSELNNKSTVIKLDFENEKTI